MDAKRYVLLQDGHVYDDSFYARSPKDAARLLSSKEEEGRFVQKPFVASGWEHLLHGFDLWEVPADFPEYQAEVNDFRFMDELRNGGEAKKVGFVFVLRRKPETTYRVQHSHVQDNPLPWLYVVGERVGRHFHPRYTRGGFASFVEAEAAAEAQVRG